MFLVDWATADSSNVPKLPLPIQAPGHFSLFGVQHFMLTDRLSAARLLLTLSMHPFGSYIDLGQALPQLIHALQELLTRACWDGLTPQPTGRMCLHAFCYTFIPVLRCCPVCSSASGLYLPLCGCWNAVPMQAGACAAAAVLGTAAMYCTCMVFIVPRI